MNIVLKYRRDIAEGGFGGIAAIVVSAIGAGVSAYGAISSAQAQKDSAKFNAAVEQNNAAMAMRQAEFDANQIREKNRRLAASQRAAYAASGVDPSAGSALDVQRDSAIQGELDALTAIYTGRVGATAATARAALSNRQASNAMTAGYIGASSSLLTGASQSFQIASNPGFRK